MKPFQIIAIDGPSGVGKSTLAKMIATQTNSLYVDTGAMFRCLAYVWKEKGLDTTPQTLSEIGSQTKLHFQEHSFFCNGIDVTNAIRKEEISKLTSQMSQFPEIRENMKLQQRQLVQEAQKEGIKQGAVLEGRDIGTVIFPDAFCKFFLKASDKVRAKRRLLQLEAQGNVSNYNDVLKQIQERDQRDQSRCLAPLVQASDAIEVDTDNQTIEQVFHLMLDAIQTKQSSFF